MGAMKLNYIVIHVLPKNSNFVPRVDKTGSDCIFNYAVCIKPNVNTLMKL